MDSLNGENVGRESYVCTPEYEKALKVWNETEEEWGEFLRALPAGQQEKAEKMKEHLEDVASAQEKRAYRGVLFLLALHIDQKSMVDIWFSTENICGLLCS